MLQQSKCEARPISVSEDNAPGVVVLKGATCEWGTEPDCLTVRVPAGLVAKAGHVPPNGGTTSEEKASIPVSHLLIRACSAN